MAKQRYGINDGYRGTVGTVIGYEWNGRWCLRSRPRKVHNPRTERQQRNRGLFAAASHLATAMGGVLRMGLLMTAREQHRTVYNHFISVNNECFSLDDEQLTVDYENLVVSEGSVAPVGFSHPALRAPLSERGDGHRHTSPPLREGWTPKADGVVSTITVPFEKNPLHLRANNDDLVYLWAWCPERMAGCLSLPAYRRSKQVSIELPSHWSGLEVHLYGFVQDYAGRTSDSTYIGIQSVETQRAASHNDSDFETQHATSLPEEIIADTHNNNIHSALEKTNIPEYETDISIGSHTGACRSSLGAGTST